MLLTLFALAGAALLYWKGWLTITQTGVLRPLVNLTVLGFAVSIKQPTNDDN